MAYSFGDVVPVPFLFTDQIRLQAATGCRRQRGSVSAAAAGFDRDGCHESDSSAGRSAWRGVDKRLARRGTAEGVSDQTRPGHDRTAVDPAESSERFRTTMVRRFAEL